MTERESTSPAGHRLRSPWAVRWRIGRLLVHLAAGLTIVALWFPLISAARRNRLKAGWSRRLLTIMGLELRVQGEIPDGCLLVANHISWLDIFVISALRPTAFVAKAEIRHWPLLGWLAKEAGTLFIQRGSRHHAQHIAHEVASLLEAGRSVAVFPEGTTGDGRDVLPFHAALIQPAISVGHPIQPLALRYRDHAGRYTAAPAYFGEMHIGQSIRQTLGQIGLVAELQVLPSLPTAPGGERRILAKAAETAIRAATRP